VPLKTPAVSGPEAQSPPAAEALDEARLAWPPAHGPARLLLASAAASDRLPAANNPVDEPADRPNDVDGAPAGDRRAAGALLIPAAALVEMALLRKRWNDGRDSLPKSARGGGALTRAARLYRRLRRGSGQTPLSSNSTGRPAS